MSVYVNESPVFLHECLTSILINQSLFPNEVVIVNDGVISKELKDVIKIFEENFPNTIINSGYKVNRGLGYSLNYGLDLCSNEIVFRMDADDICHKDRFKTQLEIFKKNPDLSIIGSCVEEFNKKPSDLKRYRNVPLNHHDINKKKLFRNPFNHMTVGFLKSEIIKAGGYVEMPGYEDYYLWLRLLKFAKGKNLKKPMVYMRVGNDMIGRRQGFGFFLKEIRFQYKIYIDKFQNLPSMINNLVFRAIPRLFPKFILEFIYHNFLRSIK